MFERPIEKSRLARRIGSSIVVHAAFLVALFHSAHSVRVREFLPGTPRGARIELSYLPGGAAAAVPELKHKQTPAVVKEARLSAPPRVMPKPTPAAQAPTPSPGATSDSSNEALGTEDIRIALTTYSPSPKPDLSRLPRGTQGDVVLDITIDPTGQVADLQILQTLGYGVDGAVADTVRTWKFSPATKDGVPVASVQELHFHYGPV
ncbi:MAG TPA: TonB family protein [Silvibacterium sp.]|nr:TonB family protein [Silvibacterium sp.]